CVYHSATSAHGRHDGPTYPVAPASSKQSRARRLRLAHCALVGRPLLEPAKIIAQRRFESLLKTEKLRKPERVAAGDVGGRERVACEIGRPAERTAQGGRLANEQIDGELRAPVLLVLLRREEARDDRDVQRSAE